MEQSCDASSPSWTCSTPFTVDTYTNMQTKSRSFVLSCTAILAALLCSTSTSFSAKRQLQAEHLGAVFTAADSTGFQIKDNADDDLTDQARARMREVQATTRTRSNQLGFTLGTSSLVPTSVGLFFSFGNERLLTHTDLRTRVEMLYLDIKTSTVTASAFGLGVSETFRLYARRVRSSAFLQLNAGIFVTQTTNTMSEDASALHLGPRLKESIGYSFNSKLQVELGLYQQWIWKSTILPNDQGFYAGMSFRI